MRKLIIWASILVPALNFTSLAHAAESGLKHTPYSISVGPSTLGFNVTGSYRPNTQYGARISANLITTSRNTTIDDVDYNAKLNFKSFGLVADYYPFANGFRLSAGAYLPNNIISGHASGALTFNNTVYATATADAKAKSQKLAPYAGLGYVYTFASGLELSADAGTLLLGKPSLDFTATSTPADAEFDADAAVTKNKLQDALNKLSVYPLVTIGVGYRF